MAISACCCAGLVPFPTLMPGRLFLYLQLCKLKSLEACLESQTVRLNAAFCRYCMNPSCICLHNTWSAKSNCALQILCLDILRNHSVCMSMARTKATQGHTTCCYHCINRCFSRIEHSTGVRQGKCQVFSTKPRIGLAWCGSYRPRRRHVRHATDR